MMGARIALLRRREGMTQTELARRIYVSPSTLGMYERSKRSPSAQTLAALSRELKVSTDYLIRGEDYPSPEIAALASAIMGIRR